MELSKLPVSGRPTNLVNSGGKDLLRLQKVRERVGWTFFSHLSLLFSLSLSLGDGLL